MEKALYKEEDDLFATDSDGMAPRPPWEQERHDQMRERYRWIKPEPVVEDEMPELQDRTAIQMRCARDLMDDMKHYEPGVIYHWKEHSFTYKQYTALVLRVSNMVGLKPYKDWLNVPATEIFKTAEKLRILTTFEEDVDMAGVMHTTMEGKKIPIYRMEDDHLIRTIGYFSVKLMENYNQTVGAGSLLDEVMMGGDGRKKSVESLKDEISRGYSHIGRFVLEAVRRGLGKEAQEALAPFHEVMSSLDTFSRPGTAALPKPLSAKTDKELGF